MNEYFARKLLYNWICFFRNINFIFQPEKGMPSENNSTGYEDKINILESEIRASDKEAAKYTALADERKAEVDRLNQDLSKLRSKLDLENEEKTNLSNKVSELIAQGLAERKIFR